MPVVTSTPCGAQTRVKYCWTNLSEMRTIRPTDSLQPLFGTRDANSDSLLTVPIPAQPRTQAATENQHNKMQNYCKTIGALAAASALVAGNASAGTSAPAPAPAPVSAPESSIEYELHVGYTSEYLWRGIDLGDDLAEAGFDVATEWNNVGLSAGVWYANFDEPAKGFGDGVHDYYGESGINEIDLYTEASYDFGFAKAAVGYIYYYNDGDDLRDYAFGPLDDAQEIYFALSRDFGWAETSFTYFWDVSGADNNGYSELALTRSFELTPCLALNLGTNVGFQFEEGQCTAWTTKVGLDWAFVERAKLSPFVALSIALSDDEDSTYTIGSDNEFVAGSMLSVSF